MTFEEFKTRIADGTDIIIQPVNDYTKKIISTFEIRPSLQLWLVRDDTAGCIARRGDDWWIFDNSKDDQNLSQTFPELAKMLDWMVDIGILEKRNTTDYGRIQYYKLSDYYKNKFQNYGHGRI